jgi:hypothetical protein
VSAGVATVVWTGAGAATVVRGGVVAGADAPSGRPLPGVGIANPLEPMVTVCCTVLADVPEPPASAKEVAELDSVAAVDPDRTTAPSPPLSGAGAGVACVGFA